VKVRYGNDAGFFPAVAWWRGIWYNEGVEVSDMITIPYNDFFADPAQYKEKAALFGIKILPKKREKKVSRRIQKKLEHLEAVVGLILQGVDIDALLEERRMSK